MTDAIKAIGDWPTNGDLIADCHRLGYLRDDDFVLDPTFGMGTFWTRWQPTRLTGTDIDPTKAGRERVDFTALPFNDRQFDACVFDPPYKLNGRPDEMIDYRYGVHRRSTWQDRMELIADGVVECARVTTRHLLIKCQDQVVSGKKRWQTDWVTEKADKAGFGKVDRLDFLSYRPQPMEGRTQRTAHVCSSQLLVFERGARWRP